MATLESRLVSLASAIAADVKALFGRTHSKSITLYAPAAAESVVLFHTSKAMTLVRVHAALPGATSTPSVTYNIRFGSSLVALTSDALPNNVTVTSTGSGNTVTASAAIPANSWVALFLTTDSGTVPVFTLTLEFS